MNVKLEATKCGVQYQQCSAHSVCHTASGRLHVHVPATQLGVTPNIGCLRAGMAVLCAAVVCCSSQPCSLPG